MKSIFSELSRRNIPRVAGVYAVVAWLIMQVAAVMTPALKLPDWVDSFFAILLLVGFPIVLIFAWAFELTPQGVKRTEPISTKGQNPNISARKLDLTILAGLVLVGILIIGDWARPQQNMPDDISPTTGIIEVQPSIAVLPFIDLSPQQDHEYFSDGLSEELLNLLAKIPDLRVAARTSSFAFKGQNTRIQEIAQALEVDHVLEGSVRRSGQEVRITAQLIDGKNGYHLWSETYDREMQNIFEVQDDIASEVVKTLQISLLGEAPKTHRTDPKAYALYLRANHLQQEYTEQAMDRAVEMLRDVIKIDPEYAPAWTNLSSALINQMYNGYLDPKVGCGQAEAAANAALRVDVGSASALSKLASLANECDGDAQRAARYYEQALSIEPRNPAILGDAAVLAESLGRLDLAIAVKEFQVGQQPVDAIAHNNLALAYYYKGRFDDAELAIRKAIAISPNYIGGHYRLGVILLMKGEAPAALEAFTKESDKEYHTKGLSLANFALGRQAESDAALAELIEGWGDIWPTEVAQTYAFRGENDAAFEWLEKRFAKDGPGGWGEQKLNPLLDNLRDDPRWVPFLEKMEVSDSHFEKIKFEFTLPR